MNKERKIPLKNYIILSLVLIISIILVIYFYMWYDTYEESKLNTTIMDEYLQVINYNELSTYLIENKDAVIYSSVLKSQEIRNFEKRFKSVIKKYSLNNDILYLDLTKELENNKIREEIRKIYKTSDSDLTITPSIIIFKNSKVEDIYSIKDNNYNVNKLVEYLKKEDIIND